MIFISTDILNPYKREIISEDSYKTLIKFLIDKYPSGFEKPTDISVNGKEIAIDDYDIELNENDVIVLLDRTALPVGLIGGWFITALANLAISVTLSYVANKLFAPDAPQSQGSPSPVYSINNAQNSVRFGSPVPIIYGKVRMYPSMIVQPLYRFENDIEYLYHVLCVGQGTNTTDNVLIGEDTISSSGDLEWKLLYKSDFYNIPLNGLGYHVTNTLTTPSNMKLINDTSNPEAGESELYIISKDASAIEFDYMLPNGLWWINGDGDASRGAVSLTYRVYSSQSVLLETNEIDFYEYSLDPIQRTVTIDTSAYDDNLFISFERTYGQNDTRHNNDLYIKRVKEIFPNEDFTNLYGDITLLVCKIKATNAVSSSGQVKVNGYFERTDVGNLMHEVLTDIYTNTSYGGGLSADDLDFPVTTETVNCCYDSSMTLFDAMRRPALAQGYSVFLAGMDVILKKDEANIITSGMYNENNIIRNSLKVQYLFKEEYPDYDGFEVQYIDGEGFIPVTYKYPDTSLRPQAVDLFGVVDYGDSGEPSVSVTGWYTVTLNSDTYGNYDIETLQLDDGYFMNGNITMDSNLDLQGSYALSNYFKSNVSGTSTILADRNRTDVTDGNYRCVIDWDSSTRKWNRTDASDYYLYPINQQVSYSHSLGVCSNDKRFLVHVTDQTTYNVSGIYETYPKLGLIWLQAGESIGDI